VPVPVVVGVDVGTGSARALAVDPDGRVVGRSAEPFPGRERWAPGRAVPAGWRAGLAAALRTLGSQLPAAARPAALALGSQSPTTVPVVHGDAVTCRHPAGVTGTPVEQHHAQRDLLRAEQGSDTEVRQLWDWLNAELGARGDVQSRWPGDPPLDGYGDMVATGQPVGEADGTWGVPAGTPLAGGAQDAYLACWAASTTVPGRALDPGGRTGGLAVAVDAGHRPEGMYAMPSAAPGIDIVGGPVAAHGLMFEWLARTLGRDPADLLALAASVPPGARGVLVLPYLEGERAPRWQPGLRAEVVGLGSEHGPAEIARAVLEGTAYGLAHIAADLADAGVGIDVMMCGGSPARSELWCQIKADVLGVPVAVPAEIDLAAYGAALAAGATAGWWPAPGEGCPGSWPCLDARTLDPRPHEAYAGGYARFVALGDAAMARLASPIPISPTDPEETP
jgi:sugar (pentulose or hexulose) kinase